MRMPEVRAQWVIVGRVLYCGWMGSIVHKYQASDGPCGLGFLFVTCFLFASLVSRAVCLPHDPALGPLRAGEKVTELPSEVSCTRRSHACPLARPTALRPQLQAPVMGLSWLCRGPAR